MSVSSGGAPKCIPSSIRCQSGHTRKGSVLSLRQVLPGRGSSQRSSLVVSRSKSAFANVTDNDGCYLDRLISEDALRRQRSFERLCQ